MNKKELSTLLHDLNSSLSSIKQAIDLIYDKIDVDTVISKKMIQLMPKKMETVLDDWEKIKDYIYHN